MFNSIRPVRSLPGTFLLNYFVILTLLSSGCVSYRPLRSDDTLAYLKRMKTWESGDGLSVSVAPLTRKESLQYFGVPLGRRAIQAVWLSIENNTPTDVIFLKSSLDPNYFTSEEAAYISHFRMKRSWLATLLFPPFLMVLPLKYVTSHFANKEMDVFFRKNKFLKARILSGEKSEGFVFTVLDEGMKHMEVLLYGGDVRYLAEFFINVPGFVPDYAKRGFEKIYTPEEIKIISDAVFVHEVKKSTCCVTGKNGKKNGDPVNIILVGNLEHILSVFASVGWDETAELNFSSGWKTFRAFLSGKHYRYSPFSALYYRGRSQDLGLQRTRDSIKERLHMRLWLAPLKYGETSVWFGTVSRDIGIRFTRKTLSLTTHKIDENIDEARDYILSSLAESHRVEQYAYLPVTEPIAENQPAENLTGDPYYTDGQVLILDIAESRTEPRLFNWSVNR